MCTQIEQARQARSHQLTMCQPFASRSYSRRYFPGSSSSSEVYAVEPGGPPGESGDDGLKLTPCGLQLDDEPFTTDDACTQPVSERLEEVSAQAIYQASPDAE